MIDTPDSGGPRNVISARSRRQAMDWSLVLASQGIAATINKTETGWELAVDEPDLERAQAAIRQYQIENRGWNWRRELPGTGMVFHWGAALFPLAIVVFYYLSTVRAPWLKEAGMVDSHAVLNGQWWRLFTAVTLHENWSHLISNAVTGFFLLGLAMARFGPGVGSLAAFLAGVVGNVASVFFYPGEHQSLGASGMVTGALGLITVQSFAPWRKFRSAAPVLPRAVAAGILVLILIGFSPGTDIAAHVAGFVAGAVIGAGLGFIRPAAVQRGGPTLAAAFALGALLSGAWLLACK